MAHLGHPILGDELHGGKSAFFGTRFKKHRHSPCRLARKNIMGIPNLRHLCMYAPVYHCTHFSIGHDAASAHGRLCLHAKALSFQHPVSGRVVTAEWCAPF
jgi:23S rRNA-/tRNA-specific pseudouridylate synthase